MNIHPKALRLKEAVHYTGLGRTKLFDLIRERRVDAVRVDGCTLILKDSLDRLIETSPPCGSVVIGSAKP